MPEDDDSQRPDGHQAPAPAGALADEPHEPVAGSGRRLGVVTGASSGIGRALAEVLAREGFDLVLAAEDDELSEATEQVAGHGTQVVGVRVDLSTGEGVDALVAAVEALQRPVDALVLNAGVGVGGAFVDGALEDHLRLIELNVTGTVRLAHRLLSPMIQRGRGRVMVTSSVAATVPGPYQSTYNASKAFLQSFSQALRTELRDCGVTVTSLMPGPTDTEFFERAGIEDTKLGRARRDDPAQVARQGYEAMVAGKDHVVAGGLRNRVQVAAATLAPERATAAVHARLSAPRSGA
jgi:short-subunit dehydrogenase